MRTSELTGAALDWAVAKCEGGYDLQLRSTYGAKTAWQYTMLDEEDPERMDKFYLADTSYSTDWQLGGPIIERELLDNGLGLSRSEHEAPDICTACYTYSVDGEPSYGPTPLIAAMRCYVASKLGETVEVPDELTKGTK